MNKRIGVTLCAILLPLAEISPATAANLALPRGTKAPAATFDATIVRESLDNHGPVVIFARYWVTPSDYKISITWAEPQGRRLEFPGYPVGLLISSGPSLFSVLPGGRADAEKSFAKPVGSRGVLRSGLGSFPIENLRFAESEFASERLFLTNLLAMLGRTDIESARTSEVPLSKPAAGQTEPDRLLRLELAEGRLISIRALDSERNTTKEFLYTYETNSAELILRREEVRLSERLLSVGFQGRGLKVGTVGRTNTFRDLLLPYDKGGRNCLVEFEPTTLGSQRLPLPVRIEVRTGKGNSLMRYAKLEHFRTVGPTDSLPSNIELAPAREEQAYMRLASKHWYTRRAEIPAADARELELLRAHFNSDPANRNALGEELRRLHALVEVDRLLEDRAGLSEAYISYLRSLAQTDVPAMPVIAGHAVVESSVFRNRVEEANMLMEVWLRNAASNGSVQTLAQFAKGELERGDCWSVACLLGAALDVRRLATGDRFAFEAQRLTALRRSRDLLAVHHGTNRMSGLQALWIRGTVTSTHLDDLILSAEKSTAASFSALGKPTPAQAAQMRSIETVGSKTNAPTEKISR